MTMHCYSHYLMCVFHFESLVQVIIRPVPTVTEGNTSNAVITLDVVRDCNEDSFNLTLVAKDGSATCMYTHAQHTNDYVCLRTGSDLHMPLACMPP